MWLTWELVNDDTTGHPHVSITRLDPTEQLTADSVRSHPVSPIGVRQGHVPLNPGHSAKASPIYLGRHV